MPRPTSQPRLDEAAQTRRNRSPAEALVRTSRSPTAAICNLDHPNARAPQDPAGGRRLEASRASDASDPDGDMTDPGSGGKEGNEGWAGDGSGDATASPGGSGLAVDRPGLRRNGRSGTPLLYKPEDATNGDAQRSLLRARDDDHDDDGAASLDLEPGDGPRDPLHRSTFSRQSTMHSRAPVVAAAAAAAAAGKKYSFAAVFLAISLVTFAIQTELSAHIQHDLGWDKAYCMMYFTHGSWIVLYPAMLLALRLQKLNEPWPVFWRRNKQLLSSTIAMIELQTLDVFTPSAQRRAPPAMYLIRTTAFITSALTIAGLSWYVAVSLTTPSDLTAIYNCSAFFAYLFSVLILREPLRLDKSVAVFIAIIGVLVVAYGDTGGEAGDAQPGNKQPGGGSRFFGNLVIGVGSVLYGLYEVLYKRYACPPEGVSPGRGTIFANTFGACIGLFTLTVLWIPLPILHMLNIEKFELPDASTGWLVLVAVLANATFSGSFLVLISLTSPVLSSVAALLTIFIVALADWFLTGQPLSWAAIMGGSMIIVAFVGLSWSTYREMAEHEARKLAVDFTDSDEDADVSPDRL